MWWIPIWWNPTRGRQIRRILKIQSCQILNFCSTMCWLWRNILHKCLRSLGQIRWKYRPKYGRFFICTVYKHLKVPSQVTMILIIHCYFLYNCLTLSWSWIAVAIISGTNSDRATNPHPTDFARWIRILAGAVTSLATATHLHLKLSIHIPLACSFVRTRARG